MKKTVLLGALMIPLISLAQLKDSTQRLVHVKGALNFRDIGGYRTKDGKTVKWNRIYRSASIAKLTDQDMDTLRKRHIYTVVDFRGTKESAEAPDRLLAGTDYQLCPAGSESLPSAGQTASMLKNNNFLNEFYGKGGLKYFGDRYRPMFSRLIALKDTTSILYHCTGGRDRTGQATALLLYALGVPQETIEADFVASNEYLKPMMAQMLPSMAKASGMSITEIEEKMRLSPELLNIFFAAIKEGYGNIDNFLDKELGIGKKEIKILKAKFTI